MGTWHISKTAGVRASVGGWTANNFSQPGGASQQSPRYISFNLDGRWQVTSNIELRASGGYTDTHVERTTAPGLPAPVQSYLNFWRVGGAAQTRAGTVDLDVYRNQVLSQYGSGVSNNKDYITHLTDLLKVDPNNTIRGGLEYRNNSIFGGGYAGTIGYQNYAIDGMWDWQISPSLDMTNAVRLDHLVLHESADPFNLPGRTLQDYNHRKITAPSFNSGLVYKVSNLDTVRLTAARGLQVPSLFETGVVGPIGPGILVLGSPNLNPTAIWNVELGYDRTIVPLGATLTTAVFFQRNTDLIGGASATPFVFEDNALISESSNIGSSNEIGFEVGLEGKTKGGFRWNASYRYASITQDLYGANAADRNPFTNYADGTPKHEVILGGGYTIGKLEMDIKGRWQSTFTDYRIGIPVDQPLVVGNYVTFNARLGYRVTKYLTLEGTAEQFNLARQVESAGDYVERRFFASATFGF